LLKESVLGSSLALGLFWILLARDAYLKVERDSSLRIQRKRFLHYKDIIERVIYTQNSESLASYIIK
jgi:hypothetical protein